MHSSFCYNAVYMCLTIIVPFTIMEWKPEDLWENELRGTILNKFISAALRKKIKTVALFYTWKLVKACVTVKINMALDLEADLESAHKHRHPKGSSLWVTGESQQEGCLRWGCNPTCGGRGSQHTVKGGGPPMCEVRACYPSRPGVAGCSFLCLSGVSHGQN